MEIKGRGMKRGRERKGGNRRREREERKGRGGRKKKRCLILPTAPCVIWPALGGYKEKADQPRPC